jgi:hypothetical protein
MTTTTDIFVVINREGRFFAGDWANIRWVEEYPDARKYPPSLAKREAAKLRAECDDDMIHAVADYGLETQRNLDWPREKLPEYSSDIPHNELPPAVEKAMTDAMNAWERLHAVQERFEKTMSQHYQKPAMGWNRLFADLGA